MVAFIMPRLSSKSFRRLYTSAEYRVQVLAVAIDKLLQIGSFEMLQQGVDLRFEKPSTSLSSPGKATAYLGVLLVGLIDHLRHYGQLAARIDVMQKLFG